MSIVNKSKKQFACNQNRRFNAMRAIETKTYPRAGTVSRTRSTSQPDENHFTRKGTGPSHKAKRTKSLRNSFSSSPREQRNVWLLRKSARGNGTRVLRATAFANDSDDRSRLLFRFFSRRARKRFRDETFDPFPGFVARRCHRRL